MNIYNKCAPWVRMITQDTALGGGVKEEPTAVSEVAAADAENQAAEQASDPELGDSDEDTDPDGRGGKRAVLAAPAREWDKRQSVQAERDELRKQLDEINRSKMTEQEKLQADVDAERRRSAELESELTTSRQQAWAREALASVGLPAEMADRPWKKHVTRPTVFTLWV